MNKYVVYFWENYSFNKLNLLFDNNNEVKLDTNSIREKLKYEDCTYEKAVRYDFDTIEEASGFFESKKSSCTLHCFKFRNIHKCSSERSVGIECDVIGNMCCLYIEKYTDGHFDNSKELDFYSEELLVCIQNEKVILKTCKPLVNYKEYDKVSIGASDIASLVMVGCQSKSDTGVIPKLLDFGEDGFYNAYVVDGNAEIGNHYKLIASYSHWLRIYDDTSLTYNVYADVIHVYRAGEFGVVIQTINYKKM